MTDSQNTSHSGKNQEESPKRIVDIRKVNQWTLPPWDPNLSDEENQKRRSSKIFEEAQKNK